MTADNASSNDTMTDELTGLIAHFGGDLTWMRCLLHVINLVAKMVTKEFDIRGSGEEDTDELMTLAEGADTDDLQMNGWERSGDGSDDADDVDGWVDEISLLTANEHARLEGNICLVKLALVKVSDTQWYSRPILTCILPFRSVKLHSRSFTPLQSSFQLGKQL